MRAGICLTIVALSAGLIACQGREQVAAQQPAPISKDENSGSKSSDRYGSESSSDSYGGNSYGSGQQQSDPYGPQQGVDPYAAGGAQDPYAAAGADPYGGAQQVMVGGPQQQVQQPSDPLAGVMPQLMQCAINESCDIEQMVMSLPQQTQQYLMSAAEQFESTGGGPLAPYAAQAQAAGFDISELLY